MTEGKEECTESFRQKEGMGRKDKLKGCRRQKPDKQKRRLNMAELKQENVH